MTPDQSTLYNKFHIISIGLRTIDRLINQHEINKARKIVERLMKESDSGMKHIMDIAGIE